MDKSVIDKISQLEERLCHHSYVFEVNSKYPVDSLIETLETELEESPNPPHTIPNVSLSFRDVIETLHQINDLIFNDEKGEIDRAFFGTDIHLGVSFYVSKLVKSLLDCHYRFKVCGYEHAEILSLYAWLLTEAWHYILCQDALDLWSIVIGIIDDKIYEIDATLYMPLIECIPPEKMKTVLVRCWDVFEHSL